MIPRVVHQVWLGGQPLPPILGAFVDAVAYRVMDSRQSSPDGATGWGRCQWSEEVLVLAFGARVRNLFARCCHVSQASDVARYLILEKLGGLYLDTDVELFELPDLDGSPAWIAGTTATPGQHGGVNGCVLASEPGGAFVSRMLAKIESGQVDLGRHMAAGPFLCGEMLGQDVKIWPKVAWHGRRGEPGAYGHHYGWGPRLKSFLRAGGMPPTT